MDITKEIAKAVYTNDIPKGFNIDESLSNRREKVYKKDNDVYLAFRGTMLNTKDAIRDLGTDTLVGLGLEPLGSRFKKGLRTANKVKEKYSDNNIQLVGHSLGGNIANYVSSKTGLKGNAFNSGFGLSSVNPSSYYKKSKVKNIVPIDDIISSPNLLSKAIGLNRAKFLLNTKATGHSI